MKNVLVFVLPGGERYAIELRWVREVFTLGPMTPVPRAPAVVAGVTAVHGQVVPVLALGPCLLAAELSAPATTHPPREGESAVLIEVEGTQAALPVDRIDAVTTLEESGERTDHVVDEQRRPVPLLDTPSLVAAARRLVGEAERAATLPQGRPGAGT